MRASLLGMFLLGAAACSSGGLAVEFLEGSDEAPFVASGEAVVEGVVCTAGTFGDSRFRDPDGTDLDVAVWLERFAAAEQTRGVAEMDDVREWTCSDGSGSFEVVHHTRFDFADFEFRGRQDVGSWEITEGTGAYAGLTGSGTVVLDVDRGTKTYAGTVEPPASE